MAQQAQRRERFALRRRQFLGASATVPAFGSILLVGCAPKTTAEPHAKWRDFVGDLCGLVIPQTDTPAADSHLVMAQDTVLNAIGVRMDDATFDMLGLVQGDLDRRCGGHYLGSGQPKRLSALTALDATSYAPGADGSPSQAPLAIAWRKTKGLILLGYYTSEVGASKELRYELLPGRFDANLPVTSETRALSSDWFAVSFR